MNISPQQKIDIIHSTIKIKSPKNIYDLAQIINLYGRPIYVLFRKHFPNYLELTGLVFAKMASINHEEDKVNVKGNSLIFDSSIDIWNFITARITIMALEKEHSTYDFSLLDYIIITIRDKPEFHLFFTERIKSPRFKTALIEMSDELLRNDPADGKQAQEIFVYIKRQLENMNPMEFQYLKNRIYQEVVRQYSAL